MHVWTDDALQNTGLVEGAFLFVRPHSIPYIPFRPALHPRVRPAPRTPHRSACMRACIGTCAYCRHLSVDWGDGAMDGQMEKLADR